VQIVIPMSGRGDRFVRAGYRDVKPLIPVDGRPMIEHVVRMYPGAERFVFVCAADHLAATPLEATLRRLVPDGVIVPIAPHKQGPVHAVLEAANAIRDDLPTLVSYCDFGVVWSFADFCRTMEEQGCDGCVAAYRGFHPHLLAGNLYATMRSRGRELLEIREKHRFAADPRDEVTSSGAYYFRDGALLKATFRRAVALDLRTNGELYCSTPYNLLVQDGRDVQIYLQERFFQWGTPDDLREYQAWSDAFAQGVDWRPSLPAAPGVSVIPMAGEGRRFLDAYAVPKPLVPVAGSSMVRRALKSFPLTSSTIALCRAEHLAGTPLRAELATLGRPLRVVSVERPTEGQAATCLLARDLIDPAAPLFVGPCDAAVRYDEHAWARATGPGGPDALVWTFRDHPHANRHPRQYGWARTDASGRVLGISCKVPLHDDVRGDPGLVGAFWFREARTFLDAADAMIRADLRVNGEFYVDTAVDVLVQSGRTARVFDVQRLACFGTPDDVATFDYFDDAIRRLPYHPHGARAAQAPPSGEESA